jgi:TonB family protein
MRTRHVLVLLLVFSYCFGPAAMAHSQQSSTEVKRKVVRRVDPTYPEAAKRLNLGGTVRVLAVVATDGTVRAVEPVGGSPLLVQAAQDAVGRWKFVPASAESKELIELHFRSE